ncbi:unnamed protein product [Ostreobium quekettii]|uniref:Ketoreductase domain-containing protein n=1 Tax=Ostreobium quekettii TaxID=121088 RepID=A0A8S1IR25_9CHLO|nr:unnamed protein product [Ostreobium quekettii]|eukprot:evm.model.scf_621EXC.3 EVM.evm.TU.scf_621EXC.3   scf_621EXC:42658-47141(+)
MTGRLVMVTGGNRGIGLEICRKLVKSGDKVLMTSRNAQAGAAAAEAIEKDTGVNGGCEVLQLDAGDAQSVQRLVDVVKDKYDGKLEGLIHNAGVLLNPWDADAFSQAKTVNYETPVAMTVALAPHVAPGCRVVMVSSGWGQLNEIPSSSSYMATLTTAQTLEDLNSLQFQADDPLKHVSSPATYKLTKAMLNRATYILSGSKLLAAKDITINACCPGWCRTDMGGGNATRSPAQGADSALWILNHPAPGPNGRFFRDGRELVW